MKKESNTGSLCPFDFPTLWALIEHKPEMKDIFETLENNIKERMAAII